nr:uncharacterized protein LOC105341823 isoform X5 [Crassostrea gigas]
MSHLFIFNLNILCIYLLGYLVEYCSPAEDCEWSAWTERDSDEFQHRAMECDGKVEIESRNCNITTCSISNGKNRTTENPPETTPIEHVDLPNHSGGSFSVKDTATLPTTKHHGNLSQNSLLPSEETVGSNNHNRSISATTQINWHGKLDDDKSKTKLKNTTDSNSTTAKTMIISQSRSDEKNQGKLETASITEDVMVLRNVSPKSDFGYAACEQRKEQELNGFRYVKECLISVLALILVIAVTAHWCRRQKRSLDCLADEMSHQFVFQLVLVCLFLFGHYCSSADDCDRSTWTDLDSDNMQHRVKDCGNGSVQIETRHCKHRLYDIPNVTEHEIRNKLPIVIYRCPKTAATPGLYHSYEPKMDLASEVPIETRETPEIPIVISDTEISTWDKNPKLNQTKLIGLQYVREYLISVLAVNLVTVVFAFWCVMQMRLRRKRDRVYIRYLPTNTDIQVAAKENHGSHAPQLFLGTDIFSEIYM